MGDTCKDVLGAVQGGGRCAWMPPVPAEPVQLRALGSTRPCDGIWEKGMRSATIACVRVRPSLQQYEVVIMNAGERRSE